jgi:hypothetical protein
MLAIITLLIEVSAFHQLCGPVLAQGHTNVLPVVEYDNESNTSWVFYGSTPYLDDNSNRISANGVGDCGWFLFADPLYKASQIYLEVHGISGRPDEYDHINIFVSDGTNELQVTVHFDYEYTWKTVNLTSYLDSLPKQVNAKVRFESNMTAAYRLSIDIAQLRIYRGAYPVVYGLTEKRAGMSTEAYCQWYSADGLSTYAFNNNASGTWLSTNITGALNGETGWINETFTLPDKTTDCIGIQFYVNDTNNYWETTGVIAYPIVSKYFSPDHANFIGNCSEWTFAASPDGRKNLYSMNTKLFFCFWTDNITCLYYSFSSNGTVWSAPTFIEDTGVSLVGAYAFSYENRGGTDYVHYAYCSFLAAGCPMRYRRGTVQANGTILWTGLQTVLENSSSAVGNLAVTPSGYVFIVYSTLRHVDNQWTQWVAFSNRTDGSWSTYTDYPKNVTSTVVFISEGSRTSIYSMDDDDDAYVILSTKGNVLQGRMIENHTLQPTENISAYVTPDGVFFSGVSHHRTVHFVYRDMNNTFRYCWRNNSSGIWTIRDEFVTDYLTPTSTGDSYSFPALSYDQRMDVVILCWLTYDDSSAWMMIRNSSQWSTRTRLLVIPNDYLFALMPSTIIPYFEVNFLFTFELRSLANNSRMVFSYVQLGRRVEGDVNHDGVVNMRDIGMVCDVFGLYLGHPRWNPDCDINGDYVVNMRDIGIVCSNFGKTSIG